MRTDFQLDRILHGQAELRWVYDCSRSFFLCACGYSLQNFGPGNSGTNRSCQVDAQGSNGEKHTGDSEWQKRQWNQPLEEDQEISWTQLP